MIISFFSCTQNKNNYDLYFGGENRSNKKIMLSDILIDSIDFKELQSSYDGDFYIRNEKLVFFDKYFGYAFQFDKKGNLEKKYYGQGAGPMEVNTGYVDGYFPLKNGDLFIGSSLDFHIHDKEQERQKVFTLPWTYGKEKNRRQLRRTGDFSGNEVGVYELNYESLKIREDKNGFIYLPIWAFTDMINPYKKDFYNKAHTLIKVDLNKGEIVDILGHFSPEYKKYNAVPQHMFTYFDINKKNNNMYISQEIDSLIYVYNDKGENIYTFGNSGKDMINKYLEVKNFDKKEFQNAYFKDKVKRGYYSNIEYFDNYDLLFRCYKKGGDSNCAGLQIYKGTTLITDVDVPKGFNWVKGYIPPYFYSNAIIDDENMKLKVYYFRLSEKVLKLKNKKYE